MIDFFSTLYSRAADSNPVTGPFFPKSPRVNTPGDTITRIARFIGTMAFATADRLFIAGSFVVGEKVLEFVSLRNGTPDVAATSAVTIAFLSKPGTPFVAASTGMRAAVPLVLGAAALPFDTSANANDQIIATITVGAMATPVTHDFIITSAIPQL